LNLTLKEVINNHDYKKANAALMVFKWASLAGVQNTDLNDLFDKIRRALTFKVKITLDHYDDMPPEQVPEDTQGNNKHYMTESETTVFLTDYDPAHPHTTFSGSGTGKYLIATTADTNDEKITPPSSYPVRVVFQDTDVCSMTLDVAFDNFASIDGETYSYLLRQNTWTDTVAASLQGEAKGGFYRYDERIDGDYIPAFIMLLQNGNVTAAEETITEDPILYSHGTLTITVTHTPK
jgi:hypothetical protein